MSTGSPFVKQCIALIADGVLDLEKEITMSELKKKEFSISLMCMDFLKIKEQIQVLNKKADMYHVDIMDGHYCKNITLSPDMVKAFKQVSELPMDVHLMTTCPDDWIDRVAEAGADIISVHAETITKDAFRIFNKIETLGCGKGLVLNPATTLESVRHYLSRVDLLTIMTVDVGFSGQPFITEMLEKIKEAKAIREKFGFHYTIQIDGSCNSHTFRRLKDAGADIYIVGGSGLFQLDEDVERAFDFMYQSYEKVIS